MSSIEKPVIWYGDNSSNPGAANPGSHPASASSNRQTSNLPVASELRDNLIALCTLNAKYIHASLGLRYLYANLGELQCAAGIHEFTINQRPIDIAEKLLATEPQIIGFGIYIWNVQQTEAAISIIKSVRPDIAIVIGGPEVSYEYASSAAFAHSDYLITGQADFAFKHLCAGLLNGNPPTQKVINAASPVVDELTLPYPYYNDDDLANRIVYVEASRGCPFKCEFCLSALDKTAYPFAPDQFLDALTRLYDRGARQFKFVDRTFNLKAANCIRILDFFLQRLSDDLFLHFEVIPDKLPAALKAKLTEFPDLTLQFEIGVQSFNPEVQATINRKQDNHKTRENIAWLRNNTNAYIHADLIFGLPGETLESFADGFDQLIALNPQEIQVGILKRLRGTTIDRHTIEFEQCYAVDPPYALLKNREIDFTTMQRMQRFARYWDMIGNSGRFTNTRPIILGSRPFDNFMRLSDWLYETTDQTSRISLARLFKLIFDGTAELQPGEQHELVAALETDFDRSGEKGRRPWESKPHVPPPGETAASEPPHNTVGPGGSAVRKTAATRQRRSNATPR